MDVFIDALLDALKVLPFLLVVYVIIEIVERNYTSNFKLNKLLLGKTAPLLGAAVGLVPQCGFSVVATNLYSRKNISRGTLLAVYIATSDEAIPIFLSNPASALNLLPIIGIKFVFALIVGYSVDLLTRKKDLEAFSKGSEEERKDIGCCHHNVSEKTEKKHDIKAILKNYALHPLAHSLKIFLYLFIINLIFGYLIEGIGEDKIAEFMSRGSWWQPVLVGLIGLIPNCASSVIISQLYILGGIGTGSCITGLCVNAGVAIAVLIKNSKNKLKDTLLIVGILYLSATLLGILISIVWY